MYTKLFQAIRALFIYVALFFAIQPVIALPKRPAEAKAKHGIEQLLESKEEYLEAFFIPDDAPKTLLMALINAEQQQILAALYNFTEPDVAKAIIAAAHRGVDVQMITDVEGLRGKYEHISDLYENGIPVHLYAEYRSLMHNKYLIFKESLGGNAVIWTGSANITKVGLTGNDENVIVTNKENVVQEYYEAWLATKNRIHDAKKNNVRLRDGCKFVGNNILVQLGTVLRRFKCFR